MPRVQSRNTAEAYKQYVAQVIPEIDPREIGFAFHGAGAEIAEKGHFWMETSQRETYGTQSIRATPPTY
jgi:hypothetical protein